MEYNLLCSSPLLLYIKPDVRLVIWETATQKYKSGGAYSTYTISTSFILILLKYFQIRKWMQ